MRKAFLSVVAICSIFIISTSCKKQTTEPTPVFSATRSMDGTVDGNSWVASSLYCGGNYYHDTTELDFNGWQQSTNESVFIKIYNYKGPGTYDMSAAGNGFYSIDDQDDYSKAGQIKIVNVIADTFLQGTYDFVTNANRRISGKFSIPIN